MRMHRNSGICTDHFTDRGSADRILHFPGYHCLFVSVTLYRAGNCTWKCEGIGKIIFDSDRRREAFEESQRFPVFCIKTFLLNKICATMSAEERKKGACSMIYFAITAAVFTLDFFLKKYIDKKYARKVKNPRLGGIICIEKFYNKGATLNLLAKHPKAMTAIHSVIMVFVAVIYYFAMRMTGKELTKTGLAMLAGGGLSNLYDRYTKYHVVDYVRFQTGPKWFQRIIFNVSDFFIFIGAVLAVIGSEA